MVSEKDGYSSLWDPQSKQRGIRKLSGPVATGLILPIPLGYQALLEVDSSYYLVYPHLYLPILSSSP